MVEVRLTITDHVAEVRLNRPERRNAVNDEIYTGLLQAAASLRDDNDVRAIVLSGEGAAFCAGMDTSGFDRMRDEGRSAVWRPPDADEAAAAVVDVDGLRLGRGQRAVLVWTTMPVPVIAAVHGAAVGLGLQLALGADIRIVAPTRRSAPTRSVGGSRPTRAAPSCCRRSSAWTARWSCASPGAGSAARSRWRWAWPPASPTIRGRPPWSSRARSPGAAPRRSAASYASCGWAGPASTRPR